jgi:hypothetical protein
MPPRALWTEDQITRLRELYPHQRTEDVAKALGRNIPAVYNKAMELGLKKTTEYMSTEHSKRLRMDNDAGAVYRFKPGMEPWNKGKSFVAGGRASETRFKPGNTPLTARPLGSFRITKDSILQRKITDEPGNWTKRWRSVHEQVWIDAHGPVPKGHIVVFKPGMRTTVFEEITLDKVECITYAENMRRNTKHRYPKEIADLMQLRGALNRQINKRSEA